MSLASFLYLTKRRVFVSYHHGGDQGYYDVFSKTFCAQFDIIRDNSLARMIDSDDVDYVMRHIRENYISGSSCTIVLCGAATYQRKYVDWEIKATLDKEHGLIAVVLPTVQRNLMGQWIAPDRLYDNLQTTYAVETNWNNLIANPLLLPNLIEQANAKRKNLINNSRQMKSYNSSTKIGEY